MSKDKVAVNELPADVAALPAFNTEPVEAPKKAKVDVEVQADEVVDTVGDKAVVLKPNKEAEKLPDPATHDYTYGKPLGETGRYKLPNGTIVETY